MVFAIAWQRHNLENLARWVTAIEFSRDQLVLIVYGSEGRKHLQLNAVLLGGAAHVGPMLDRARCRVQNATLFRLSKDRELVGRRLDLFRRWIPSQIRRRHEQAL